MSDVGIAQLLLRGSKNIDLMRKEINQLFSMIFGLVYPECSRKNWQPVNSLGALVIEGEGCDWKVEARKAQGGFYAMSLHLCFGNHETMVFSTTGQFSQIHTEDVQTAYENLDSFVVGMVGAFPAAFVFGLKPFTQAAEMKM